MQEQIQTVAQKWNPETSSGFSTYLYNMVPPDAAPFYRPGPTEDEDKWEDALRAAPAPGAIPVLVRGFQQLGARVVNQERHLAVLQGRLHEIADGLADLLRRHDLEVSVRAQACRRNHERLAKRVLGLASRAQVLRNRGYALDGAEEELRTKLTDLEKKVMDPGLAGREEEIWARMVALRERGRMLEEQLQRANLAADEGDTGTLDNETMKAAKKVRLSPGAEPSGFSVLMRCLDT